MSIFLSSVFSFPFVFVLRSHRAISASLDVPRAPICHILICICICNCICICAEQSSRHISLSWYALSPHLPHQSLVLGLSPRWLARHLYWWDSRIAWESPIKEASSSTANEPLSMQNVSAADLWWASNRIRWGGLTLLKLIVIVDHIAALCMGSYWRIPK